MIKDVIIFGAGSMARMAYVFLKKNARYNITAFTVHESYIQTNKLFGLDVVPFETLHSVIDFKEYMFFIAMGFASFNKARAKIYFTMKERGYDLISYVSPFAQISDFSECGESCFIFENASVQPFTYIGNDVVIASGVTIGHDVEIADHCFIGPGAVIPGNIKIGAYTLIGANATIKDGVRIGEESVIGAGATILKNTAPQSVHLTHHSEAVSITSHSLNKLMNG